MKHKISKTLWVLSILYLITHALDIFSTVINGELVQYLEANPLFDTGGLALIILINLLLLAYLMWAYKRCKSPFTRFVYTNIFVTVIIARVFVIINNFQVYANPIPLEVAKQITPEMLQASAIQFAATSVVPLVVGGIVGLITYFVFQFDHDIVVKEAGFKKKDYNIKDDGEEDF